MLTVFKKDGSLKNKMSHLNAKKFYLECLEQVMRTWQQRKANKIAGLIDRKDIRKTLATIRKLSHVK
jgi:hypothetical protein